MLTARLKPRPLQNNVKTGLFPQPCEGAPRALYGRETKLGLEVYERFAKPDKQPLGCGEGGTAGHRLGEPGSGRIITDGRATGGA